MKEKEKRTGRTPKLNPKTHCVMVRFDDEEHARFLTMYEQSSMRRRFLSRRGYSVESLRLSKWTTPIPNTIPNYRTCTPNTGVSVSITTKS